MPNTFFAADLHLGHKRLLGFTDDKGRPVRHYATLDDMHYDMIQRWNERVRMKDTVYVLGDLCMNEDYMYLTHELRGRKILIPGNHDERAAKHYLDFFHDVIGYKTFSASAGAPGIICSHIPLHPESVKRWGANVHGHLHQRNVMTVKSKGLFFRKKVIDPRYACVSMEQINYTPISLEEVRARLVKQQEEYDAR